MNDGDDGVDGNGERNGVNALFDGALDLGVLHEAGGVGDVAGPVDDGLDAVAAAAA